MISTSIDPPAALYWYPANFSALNRRFEQSTPQTVLRWALTTYHDDLVMATGFGVSGVALMHMLSQIRPQTTVFFLDTELLFAETYDLRRRLEQRLGIRILSIYPQISVEQQQQRYGDNLWRRAPDRCCRMRKVDPLRDFLQDKRAWLTAIRRDQSPSRAATPIVGWDQANMATKICPLANWTRGDVWRYVLAHDLPYNELHDRGYPSIGCRPCTAPAPASDERAGRWSGSSKQECGIHSVAIAAPHVLH